MLCTFISSLDARYRTWKVVYRIQDIGYTIQDTNIGYQTIHGTLESYMILDKIVDRLQATGYWIHDICALAQSNGYMFRIQDTRSIPQEYTNPGCIRIQDTR